MFSTFFLVWMIAHAWVMESSGLLYCLNPYSFQHEMILFNRYVWDKLRPFNEYFNQNMAKKTKSIL